MTKIIPPLPKGQRERPSRQVTMYKDSIDKLDKLVARKNTTRVQYLRWAMDCAETGLIGPTPGVELESETASLVTSLLDGQMTHSEGAAALERLVFRACQAQREHSEAEWSGSNDND